MNPLRVSCSTRTLPAPGLRGAARTRLMSSASSSAQAPSSLSNAASAFSNPKPTHNAHTSSSITGAERPLRMIMFGKPGAGKGTLSTRLVAKYGPIESISTGNLLRSHVQNGTELGKRAEAIMASGGILDDQTVLGLVEEKLSDMAKTRSGRNWILDGFPRTLGQGQMLDPVLERLHTPLTLIVNLDVADEVILSRIAERWVHAPSGRVYNMGYNRPKVDGLDDITGEPLTKRPDDNPEVASRRLRAFYETTEPLLQYYTARSNVVSPPTTFPLTPSPHLSNRLTNPYLVHLTGRTSDEIWPQLEGVVQEYFGLKAQAASVPPTDVGVVSVDHASRSKKASATKSQM